LNDFIEEINLLQKDGVYIDKKKYAVQLKHIICDIPARKFLKQIKGYGGYAAHNIEKSVIHYWFVTIGYVPKDVKNLNL